MERKEWIHAGMDKTKWGEGPWQTEADKVQWTDETTGLPCVIVRQFEEQGGAWCGYVGVSEGHPLFQKNSDECGEHVRVLNNVTYTDFCAKVDEGAFVHLPEDHPVHKLSSEELQTHMVCHVVESGENDRVWWIGFHCASAFNFMPGMAYTIERVLRASDPNYKCSLREMYEAGLRGEGIIRSIYVDQEMVTAACADLATQLHEMVA